MAAMIRQSGPAPSRQGAPLITCAMVSLAAPSRLDYVKASIADYLRQSYPDKELLVVLDGQDMDARETLIRYLAALERPDIRVVEVPGKVSLGRLRNLSFQQARGEVVCQWDDDDRHHPDRLSVQAQALLDGDCEASYLQNVLHYFPHERRLYLSNWAPTPERSLPGTLMTWRTAPIRYPEHGPEAHLGEDSHVAMILNARGKVRHIEGMAHLYIYVSHGANSWHDAHHRRLVDLLAISRGLLRRREAALREGLQPFGFSAYPVTLHGSNGAAFEMQVDGDWRAL